MMLIIRLLFSLYCVLLKSFKTNILFMFVLEKLSVVFLDRILLLCVSYDSHWGQCLFFLHRNHRNQMAASNLFYMGFQFLVE